MDSSKQSKQIFYLTKDGKVFTNFSDIPSESEFEECEGMWELFVTAYFFSDKAINILKNIIILLMLVVFLYFGISALINYIFN